MEGLTVILASVRMTAGDELAATAGVSGCGACRATLGRLYGWIVTPRGIPYFAKTRNRVLEPLSELQAGSERNRNFGRLF